MGKRKNAAAPQNYVVEKILDRYIDEFGNKWFHLKWLGYPNDQATWEPENNVDCTGLIKKFEKNHVKSRQSVEWSLKQDTGSSTKIVLKKVNVGKNEENYKENSLSDIKVNGDSGLLPVRNSKRRRSSTIGVELDTSKSKRTTNKKSCFSESQPLNEEYTVESIEDKCLDSNGRILYHIKWFGYEHLYNTWEPEDNLNCPELLQSFNSRNKLPKVIVSKILDKRKYEDRTEYLVKVSGCRKEKWMFESELNCSDLLDSFNKSYNAKNSKISLADIADDCSSDEHNPKSVVNNGIKINKDCTTSSDEDSMSPIANKEKVPHSNGTVSKQRNSHSSSSDSNVDFEDLMKRYNNSRKNGLASAPPSPPAEMSLKLDRTSPDHVSMVKSKSPENVSMVKSESLVPMDNKKGEKVEPITANISDEDTSYFPSDATNSRSPESFHFAKFQLPQLNIPKKDKSPPSAMRIPESHIISGFSESAIRRSPSKTTTQTPAPSSPSDHTPCTNYPLSHSPDPPVYPGILTSDRGRGFSKEVRPDLKSHPFSSISTKTSKQCGPPSTAPIAPLTSYLKPMRSASDDSDTDDSISDSELESKLTAALADPASSNCDSALSNEPQPATDNLESLSVSPQPSYSGVDLGALIFSESEKSGDASLNMSGLLDSIVGQASAVNSLHTAFLDTSIAEKDLSHSELFNVVAQHSSHQKSEHPTECEIDNVLSELYETASGSDSITSSVTLTENKTYFAEPVIDEDDETEPLDPPLNNILGLDDDIPYPKSTISPVRNDKPTSHPTPPFTAFQNTLSTFGKPPRKSKTPSVKKNVKKASTKKAVKPVKTFKDDIFSDLGNFTSKKTNGSKTVTCPLCNRKFRDKSKLDYHISSKHPQTLEMACENCGDYFQSAIEYQCHVLSCGASDQ